MDRSTRQYRRRYWRNHRTGEVEVFDPGGRESHFARPPGFASLAAGLVSTVDDYLAFASMMLNRGEYEGVQLLSQSSVELMTSDHITPEQKTNSPFAPDFWKKRGWGLGVCVMTGHKPGDPRGIDWDGGYGTSAYWDRDSALIGILMTQRLWESPTPPAVNADFWRTAYQAIDI
jgi:CubicO group peptidase (beta-lactamase class C family)